MPYVLSLKDLQPIASISFSDNSTGVMVAAHFYADQTGFLVSLADT